MAYRVDYRIIPEIREALDESFEFLNAVLDQVGDRKALGIVVPQV